MISRMANSTAACQLHRRQLKRLSARSGTAELSDPLGWGRPVTLASQGESSYVSGSVLIGM